MAVDQVHPAVDQPVGEGNLVPADLIPPVRSPVQRHHPRPIELYRGRLILYGCGDFIDDYEGIAGHREYRDDLRLMYFASLRRGTGELAELRMVAMQARKLRLSHASGQDRRWLAATLGWISRPFGAAVELTPDGLLVLHPPAGRR